MGKTTVGQQRTSTVVTTAIRNGVKTVVTETTVTREHVRGKRRSGATWLILELGGVVVWKVGSAIGHALAEILMGRMP